MARRWISSSKYLFLSSNARLEGLGGKKNLRSDVLKRLVKTILSLSIPVTLCAWGGDVIFSCLDALPGLAPGSVVHFHDIGTPYEYPKVDLAHPTFRVSWTEACPLKAILICNPDPEILLRMNCVTAVHCSGFCKVFEFLNPAVQEVAIGSSWMGRIS